MPRKSKNQRKSEQRARQQRVREKARAARRPSRDDIARMFLWQTISEVSRNGDQGRSMIRRMADKVISGLERQGFDDRQSYDVFDELVRKYSNGPCPFRPKRHLDKEREPPST